LGDVAKGRESTLDLIGPGLTLFTRPDDDAWLDAATTTTGRPPVGVRASDEITARAMGIRAGGALLVRPDAAPAGWWPGHVEPRTVLHRAIADVRSSPGTARAA
jgi:putative polyketide hydroxylase